MTAGKAAFPAPLPGGAPRAPRRADVLSCEDEQDNALSLALPGV